MAILIDWERERYLAYECKRLNVTHNRKRESLSMRYVKEGMIRFITEQYADGLPIGCMLGYVIDGDMRFAVGKVHKAIAANQSALALVQGPVAALPIEKIERFFTTHTRPASKETIELRHALLPFVLART